MTEQLETKVLAGAGSKKEVNSLDFVLDIPLEVSVELGRAKMLISDLLQLGQGPWWN